MTTKLTQPRVRIYSDLTRAMLDDAYTIEVWPVAVMIMAGFEFDGASIPKVAWPLIGDPWDPRRLPAATVHDWLYASHVIPRWQADLVFLWLLLRNGHGWWRSLVDWWAVARFGRSAWQSHDRFENAHASELGWIHFL